MAERGRFTDAYRSSPGAKIPIRKGWRYIAILSAKLFSFIRPHWTQCGCHVDETCIAHPAFAAIRFPLISYLPVRRHLQTRAGPICSALIWRYLNFGSSLPLIPRMWRLSEISEFSFFAAITTELFRSCGQQSNFSRAYGKVQALLGIAEVHTSDFTNAPIVEMALHGVKA